MARNWFSIKNVAQDRAEISVFDEIGAWGVTARDFIAQFKAIGASNVDLYVNSPGGSVMDAIAMLNAMTASGKNITVTVMGIAASAASYLVLAGKKRVMPENTYQFLHDPLTGIWGDAEELRAAADELDKIGEGLMATYATRCNRPVADIKALMAADSLLSAQECLDAGLADEVTPAIMVTAKFDADRPDLPKAARAIFAKAQPAARAEVPFALQIKEMAERAGLGAYAKTFAMDDSIATIEAAQQAVAAAGEIVALCDIAGKADMAPGLIQARKAVPEARREIQAVLVAEDEAARVDTARRVEQTVKPQDGFSVTEFWQNRSNGSKQA